MSGTTTIGAFQMEYISWCDCYHYFVSDNDIVHVDYYLTVRTIGSSGRVVGHGIVSVGVTSLTKKNVSYSGTDNFDTTSDMSIRLTNQWSIAHADNSMTAKSFVVEIKRLEIPNNNFIIEGDGANNSKVTFSTNKAGIVLEPNTFNTSGRSCL